MEDDLKKMEEDLKNKNGRRPKKKMEDEPIYQFIYSLI